MTRNLFLILRWQHIYWIDWGHSRLTCQIYNLDHETIILKDYKKFEKNYETQFSTNLILKDEIEK
jgi:hypothetical protein